MYDRLFFFNHYGNGDVFESREFVREIMGKLPHKKCVYYTIRSPRILEDIEGIRVDSNFPGVINATDKIKRIDNDLYINTWIGRDSKYVLPGYACTLEKLYEMYNEILSELGDYRLDNPPIEYLTNFKHKKEDIEAIDLWMWHHDLVQPWYPLIYISNGPVHSSQASNFDMTQDILYLARMYRNYNFFITQPISEKEENIIDANTLTHYPDNLVDLSYLSSFCKVLIGRNSGPHVFTWTKQNCMDEYKINITFSYNKACQHFVYNTPIRMKKYWTSSTEMFSFVSTVLNEELK